MLHELGHIAIVNSNFHPPWNPKYFKKEYRKGKYPSFDLSWNYDKNKNRINSKNPFRLQIKVVYYWGAKLKGEDAVTVYNEIEKRDFPSLYAATSFGDDFAESYVTYIHTVLMKNPFAINLYKDNKLIKEFKTCWGKPRCAKKEKILAEYFEQ